MSIICWGLTKPYAFDPLGIRLGLTLQVSHHAFTKLRKFACILTIKGFLKCCEPVGNHKPVVQP